jgi:leader peptidase (prepilin peptidase)/N-methyltransferase
MLGAVAASFYWRRGYAGLGGGDIKFAGAAGFWVGWQGIPWLLLMASLSGLVFALIALERHSQNNLKRRLPFGPFLCGGTFAIWMSQVLH